MFHIRISIRIRTMCNVHPIHTYYYVKTRTIIQLVFNISQFVSSLVPLSLSKEFLLIFYELMQQHELRR